MDKELIKLIFLKARDQFESAVRWAFLAVVIAAIFHLLTFSRFLSINKRLEVVQEAIDNLSQVETVLRTTISSLEHNQTQIEVMFEQKIEYTVSGLVNDFQILSTTVDQIRNPSELDLSPLDPNSLQGDTSQAQQAPIDGPSVQPVFNLDEHLENAIRQAETKAELQQLLIPVIEEKIIQPRFDELNEFWRSTILADLDKTVMQAKQNLDENRNRFPGDPSEIEEIITNLDQTLDYMESIVLVPPANDQRWWASVSGKEATFEGIEDDVLSDFLDTSSVMRLRDVQAKVEEAYEKQALLLDEINTDLKTLEVQFKEQQVQLATLGKPFEFISLELAFMVSIFPLLLGILLSASIVWPAYRLRELAWAVDEMVQESDELTLLGWFSRRSGLKLQAVQTKVPEERMWHKLGDRNRAWIATNLARVLFYCAWISLATWQLYGWAEGHTGQTIRIFLAGIILIILSGLYSWYVALDIVSPSFITFSDKSSER